MNSNNDLNAVYVKHVATLEGRLSEDAALRRAVGGEFLAIGQLEYHLLRSRGLGEYGVVVDVGCGSGRLACHLVPFAGIRYVGSDVVPRLLEYARELCGRSDWQFIHTDGTRIPVEDSSADFVTFFSVFTHLPQEQIFQYFREALRVLKPGGIMIMSFLEFRVPLHWANFIASVEGKREDNHLNQYIERDSIRLWAQLIGLELRGIHGGDTVYIPLPETITFENGTSVEGSSSLGQSVAILQKPVPATELRQQHDNALPPVNVADPLGDGNASFLSNASARFTLAPNGTAMLGFTIAGPSARRVLVRAVGPGLESFGIAEVVKMPALEIFAGDERIDATSTPWGGRGDIVSAISLAGAFTVRPDSNDVMLCPTAKPGNYTAHVRDQSGKGGEVLVEVFLL